MKGPYCDPNLKFNLVYKNNVSNSKFSDGQDFSKNRSQKGEIIKINSRSSTILPEFVGFSFAVYNGKEYKTFGVITPNHVGNFLLLKNRQFIRKKNKWLKELIQIF